MILSNFLTKEIIIVTNLANNGDDRAIHTKIAALNITSNIAL